MKVFPDDLFQMRYRDDPWKLLCCVILLNLTSGDQLEGIHIPLFQRWGSAMEMALADESEIAELIAPLGLQNRRARSLKRMSLVYALFWDGRNPKDLPGIGKYGSDSYRIFIRGELNIPVEDKELRKYLEWVKSQK